MIFRFFLRQTQPLGVSMLIGSLAACTHLKSDGNPAQAEGTRAGAAADASSGNTAGKKKASDVTQSSALDSQISALRQQVAVRRQFNEKLRTFMTDKERQLSAILGADRAAGPSVQEFDLRTSIHSKLSEIDREARAWQETIDAHKAVLDKATGDPHAAELQTEINQFSEQRAELLRQRAKLAALPDKLK
jgi:hypothetical protein